MVIETIHFVAGIETTSGSWRGVLNITLCDKYVSDL